RSAWAAEASDDVAAVAGMDNRGGKRSRRQNRRGRLYHLHEGEARDPGRYSPVDPLRAGGGPPFWTQWEIHTSQIECPGSANESARISGQRDIQKLRNSGARRKAGGVTLARDVEAVRSAAAAMLGTHLKTKQTGPEGLPVERIYVESGSDIEREIYLSLTLNREKSRIALIASAAGGMDIEE